jgi:hypothetical protein
MHQGRDMTGQDERFQSDGQYFTWILHQALNHATWPWRDMTGWRIPFGWTVFHVNLESRVRSCIMAVTWHDRMTYSIRMDSISLEPCITCEINHHGHDMTWEDEKFNSDGKYFMWILLNHKSWSWHSMTGWNIPFGFMRKIMHHAVTWHKS